MLTILVAAFVSAFKRISLEVVETPENYTIEIQWVLIEMWVRVSAQVER